MSEPIWYMLVTGVVLLLLLALYSIEDVRGKRIFLSGPRVFLDKLIGFVYDRIVRTFAVFVSQLVKFLLHHGAQALIRKILNLIRSWEDRLESMLRRPKKNHRRSDDERMRTHLDDIADHKEASALTEQQKQELRDR